MAIRNDEKKTTDIYPQPVDNFQQTQFVIGDWSYDIF